MSTKTKTQSFYCYDPKTILRLREELSSLSEDDQYQEIIDSNQHEPLWALHLIRAGLIEPNVFCSSDWLHEFQERYRDVEGTPSILSELVDCLEPLGYEFERVVDQPDSNFATPPFIMEAMEILENQWGRIDDLSDNDFDWREVENDIPNLRNLTPVHAFLDSVARGRYPTPEITFAIAKAFDLYFTAAGELSLEEVFFGKPKRRSGNFASRSVRELRYMLFYDTVRREQAFMGHEFKISELAEKFLTYENMDEEGNVRHFDVDTFLRGYRRWRKSFEEEREEEES